MCLHCIFSSVRLNVCTNTLPITNSHSHVTTRSTDGQTEGRLTDKQTIRQTDRQTDKQTDRQKEPLSKNCTSTKYLVF